MWTPAFPYRAQSCSVACCSCPWNTRTTHIIHAGPSYQEQAWHSPPPLPPLLTVHSPAVSPAAAALGIRAPPVT
jgi:hypothetical protein